MIIDFSLGAPVHGKDFVYDLMQLTIYIYKKEYYGLSIQKNNIQKIKWMITNANQIMHKFLHWSLKGYFNNIDTEWIYYIVQNLGSYIQIWSIKINIIIFKLKKMYHMLILNFHWKKKNPTIHLVPGKKSICLRSKVISHYHYRMDPNLEGC